MRSNSGDSTLSSNKTIRAVSMKPVTSDANYVILYACKIATARGEDQGLGGGGERRVVIPRSWRGVLVMDLYVTRLSGQPND